LDGRLVGWRHRIVGQSIMTDTALAAVWVNNGSGTGKKCQWPP
jgi:isoquinoline 1-oxidoreductase beta subunit